jgi:hypothetical protein
MPCSETGDRLDIGLERFDLPQEPFGGRHYGVPKLLAAGGAGLERAGGALELAQTIDQGGALGNRLQPLARAGQADCGLAAAADAPRRAATAGW